MVIPLLSIVGALYWIYLMSLWSKSLDSPLRIIVRRTIYAEIANAVMQSRGFPAPELDLAGGGVRIRIGG